MAINLDERYPGRANGKTLSYPQGSFKNRTSPTSKDGTYLEQDWANDQLAFFQSLIKDAALTVNNEVDTVEASQYFEALILGVQSRISQGLSNVPAVNMRVFTSSGTWTKPAGLKSVVVEVQGAGGSGGGAMVATSGNASIGGGGLGGGYARKRILVDQLGTAEDVTVGAGGARVAGGTGLTGGQSSFGAHCSATGGGFGGVTTANNTLAVISSNGSPGIGIGGDVNSAGGFSRRGIRFDGTSTGSFAGDGGGSYFCGSQGGTAGNNNGIDALSYGGGGGGAHSTGSPAKEGGKGGDGLVIVWEYF